MSGGEDQGHSAINFLGYNGTPCEVEWAVTGADIGGRISASRGDAEVRPQGKENRRKLAAEGGSDAPSGIENVVIDKKFSRRLLAACGRTVPEDSAKRRETDRERERGGERECTLHRTV